MFLFVSKLYFLPYIYIFFLFYFYNYVMFNKPARVLVPKIYCLNYLVELSYLLYCMQVKFMDITIHVLRN